MHTPTASFMSRPPPITVDDDDRVRRDFVSADIRRTFPDIPPPDSSVTVRNSFLQSLDERAYKTIHTTFPMFTPPRLVNPKVHRPVSGVSDVRRPQMDPVPTAHSTAVSEPPPLH